MPDKPSGNLSALKLRSDQRAGAHVRRARRWPYAIVLITAATLSRNWWLPELTALLNPSSTPPSTGSKETATVANQPNETAPTADPRPTAVASSASASGKSAALDQFSSTGYVQARESSQVAPKVPGRVLKIHVRQGERVEVGQLLIELDPADEQATLLVAERERATIVAQARRARARIDVVKANHAIAVRRAQRAQNLSAQGVSASAAAEDLQATAAALASEVRAAEADLQVAQARTHEAAARVEQRRTRLGNLSLVAPFRGVVVNEPPHVGEFIGPQPAGVAADMGGLRIANLDTLRVETDIPETRYRLLHVGTAATIHLDAFPDKSFAARVQAVTSQVNRAKATIRVNVEFVGPTPGVVPNLAARVDFRLTEPKVYETD